MSRPQGMYLAVLPAYRRECINELIRKRPGLLLMCSAAHLDPSVKTGIPSGQYKSVRMVRLGRVGFLQIGEWRAALGCRDLIVDMNPRSLTAWFLLVTRKMLNRRTVAWGHYHPQDRKKRGSGGARRIMRRLADGTVTYTYSNLNEAIAERPNGSVWVAPNALYTASQIRSSVWSAPSIRNNLIYVGRLEPAKKVDLAVRAFAVSGLASLGVRLSVVGAGSEITNLRALSEELEISNSVDFIGWVDELDEIARHYSTAFASLSPGFAGLGLTQSLGFGVPMLVADNEPHSPEIELAENRLTTWFRSNDAESMAGAMREAWAARETVPLSYARDRILEKYTAEKMAAGLLDALDGRGQ